MSKGGERPITKEEALGRASELVRRADEGVWGWLREGHRLVFILVTAIVLSAALLLDGLGGEKGSKMAGHLIDLAKFLLPAVLASSAVVSYGKSRLLCCVMEHAPPEGKARS
jgi:hypothetical protein